jgi:hypothetical protein
VGIGAAQYNETVGAPFIGSSGKVRGCGLEWPAVEVHLQCHRFREGNGEVTLFNGGKGGATKQHPFRAEGWLGARRTAVHGRHRAAAVARSEGGRQDRSS